MIGRSTPDIQRVAAQRDVSILTFIHIVGLSAAIILSITEFVLLPGSAWGGRLVS